MKLMLKTLKPRNPLVAPSRMRQAGAHKSGSRRARAQRALRRELDDALRPHS